MSDKDLKSITPKDFQRFFYLNPDIIMIISQSGELLQVNSYFYSKLGWEEHDIQEKKIFDFVHEDDTHIFLTAKDQLLDGQEVESMIIRLRKKDGEYLTIDCSSNIDDEYRIYVIGHNISELIRLKEEREKQLSQLERLKIAVDGASDQIVITDNDANIIYVNNATEKITGYMRDEILGTKAGVLWGKQMPSEYYKDMWHQIKHEKKTYIGHVKNKRKSGEIYWAEVKISPVTDPENNVEYFVGIERDITKEKNIDRMKTEFISLASHQLRTPLSAMKWFTEMLLDGDMGELTQEQKQSIKNISDSNERMIELVGALLNVSRIESGRIIIEPEPTNIGELVQTVVDELKEKYSHKKQQITVSVHPELPEVMLDKKMIRNVLMNLVTNSIKYSPEGGTIELVISRDGDHLLARVTDSGMGIPVGDQNRVFEKFFRAENAVKSEADGTGLGLYLAKAIVESSGGKMWFDSTVGEGTTFWFTLPLSGMSPKSGEVHIDT